MKKYLVVKNFTRFTFINLKMVLMKRTRQESYQEVVCGCKVSTDQKIKAEFLSKAFCLAKVEFLIMSHYFEHSVFNLKKTYYGR